MRSPTRPAWSSDSAASVLHVAVRHNIDDDEIIVETAYQTDRCVGSRTSRLAGRPGHDYGRTTTVCGGA